MIQCKKNSIILNKEMVFFEIQKLINNSLIHKNDRLFISLEHKCTETFQSVNVLWKL